MTQQTQRKYYKEKSKPSHVMGMSVPRILEVLQLSIIRLFVYSVCIQNNIVAYDCDVAVIFNLRSLRKLEKCSTNLYHPFRPQQSLPRRPVKLINYFRLATLTQLPLIFQQCNRYQQLTNSRPVQAEIAPAISKGFTPGWSHLSA